MNEKKAVKNWYGKYDMEEDFFFFFFFPGKKHIKKNDHVLTYIIS